MSKNNIKFIALAAMGLNGEIGIGNDLPWYLPEDLKHFKETTMHKWVLMGLNTFNTLPINAKKDRNYIVLCNSDKTVISSGYQYKFKSISELLNSDDLQGIKEIYIAGGAMIYDTLLEHCEEAIVTWIDNTYPNADKFFPVDRLTQSFEEYSNNSWLRSKSGTLYKIAHYIKI